MTVYFTANGISLGGNRMRNPKIPEATVVRLSVYSRYLAKIARKGVATISSGEIARGVGVSAAQVRKDLAYFGEFGTRGVGYNIKDLHGHIIRILGLSVEWSVALVGVGNLGTALTMYGGFRERGFYIRAIFDVDRNKVGQVINGIEVNHLDVLEKVIRQTDTKIGVICVPADQAQDVANRLVRAGLRGILNFTPHRVVVPETVDLRNVDLSVNLEVLSFNMKLRHTKTRPNKPL